MTGDEQTIPPFPVMRYTFALLLLAVVGAVLTTAALIALDQATQITPALAGLAVCTVGGVIALELVRRGARRSMERLAVMCMAGTSARLGATLLGGLGLVFLGGMDVRATVSWLAVWYVLLLVVEMKLLTGYLRSLPGAGPGADPGVNPGAGAGAVKTFDIAEGR